MEYLVRVPGKIMLGGAYAVLKGGTAIASPIDCYLSARSKPWHEDVIRSELLAGDDNLSHAPVLEALELAKHMWRSPTMRIDIDDALQPRYGAGSSTAVRLAVMISAALQSDVAVDRTAVWDIAREVWQMQRNQQSFASGYDVATQTQGELVMMTPTTEEMWPGLITSSSQIFDCLEPIVEFWVHEHGSATASIGRDIVAWIEKHALWDRLLDQHDRVVKAFETLSSGGSFHELIAGIAEWKQLFSGSKYVPEEFSRFDSVPGFDETWTVLPSGAGGYDTAILFGSDSDRELGGQSLLEAGWERAPFRMSRAKLTVETLRQREEGIMNA